MSSPPINSCSFENSLTFKTISLTSYLSSEDASFNLPLSSSLSLDHSILITARWIDELGYFLQTKSNFVFISFLEQGLRFVNLTWLAMSFGDYIINQLIWFILADEKLFCFKELNQSLVFCFFVLLFFNLENICNPSKIYWPLELVCSQMCDKSSG